MADMEVETHRAAKIVERGLAMSFNERDRVETFHLRTVGIQEGNISIKIGVGFRDYFTRHSNNQRTRNSSVGRLNDGSMNSGA